MLTLNEYAVGKIWADTDSPIIFLKPKPLLVDNSRQELFRIVHDMSRSLLKKNAPRLFLLLDLQESNGSDPILMADYLRYQLRFRMTGLPLALSVVRSTDDQLMRIVEAELRRFNAGKASIHSSFDEALKRISELMKADLTQGQESWLGRMSSFFSGLRSNGATWL